MSNIGRVIHGYCWGMFSSDTYSDKRIEAEGWDWVVAREIDGGLVVIATFLDDKEKQKAIEEWSRYDDGENE